MERMDVEAVAELPCQATHVGVHARNVDRHVRVLDRSSVEERRHQGEVVELPLEVWSRTVLPAVPHCADHLNHLAQLRPRMFPFHAEAALVVTLHLSAEPEHETAPRCFLQVP